MLMHQTQALSSDYVTFWCCWSIIKPFTITPSGDFNEHLRNGVNHENISLNIRRRGKIPSSEILNLKVGYRFRNDQSRFTSFQAINSCIIWAQSFRIFVTIFIRFMKCLAFLSAAYSKTLIISAGKAFALLRLMIKRFMVTPEHDRKRSRS